MQFLHPISFSPNSVSNPAATAQLRITAVKLLFPFCIVLKTEENEDPIRCWIDWWEQKVFLSRQIQLLVIWGHSSVLDTFFYQIQETSESFSKQSK